MPDVNEISSTTQKFLDIFDITSDVVILKDGTISIILVVSAMNFGLLAEQEQDAIIYAYASLLNSLNFPIQIIISSKTKDATAYLHLLDEQAEKASTNNKKELIKRYQGFVGKLIKERNVLDKKFYVVIPANPGEVGMITPQSVLPGKSVPDLTREQKTAILEKGIGVLEPRRDHLIAQFNRIGLYARQILTQEIIEFFYNSYNPEAYEGQQITDNQSYTTMGVQAQTTPDLAPLESLTQDNNSNKETFNSPEEIPEAGTADITESAVVPKDIPETPDATNLDQNTPKSTATINVPQNNVELDSLPPQNIPPQIKKEQTIFQTESKKGNLQTNIIEDSSQNKINNLKLAIETPVVQQAPINSPVVEPPITQPQSKDQKPILEVKKQKLPPVAEL
ncbi:MAG: hypothetical protein HOE40_01710 [Candidatus Pacebacteria bacterium]|nr:hypothetical protein [Candidatus Paceibacterota bacterium]